MATAEEVLARFVKKHGDKVGSMGDNIPAPDRMPTGILEFDVASGGGIPRGHLSIVFGAKDSGKSTFCYKAMATELAAHPKMKVAFFDAEGNYDSEYGQAIGIDEGRLMFLQPDYAEQAGDMILEVIRDAEDVGLIVVDSMAALTPEVEDVKSMEDAVVGRGGLLTSRLLKVSNTRLIQARKDGRAPTCLYVNQQRAKIGGMRPGMTQPGGHAPQFYSSMMVQLWGGKEIIDPDVDPNRAVIKQMAGLIVKKKGPIVCRKLEFEMAVVQHKGMRPGDTKDWGCAVSYLGQMDQFGKKGKGWVIMGHDFPRQRDCRAWYDEHKAEARDAIISFLTDNPGAI